MIQKLRERFGETAKAPVADDAHPILKDALAVRNQATVDGVCPRCRAEIEIDGPLRLGHITYAVIAHEPECPAGNERLFELRRRYGA